MDVKVLSEWELNIQDRGRSCEAEDVRLRAEKDKAPPLVPSRSMEFNLSPNKLSLVL